MNAELHPPRRLKHLQRHQRHRRRGYNQGTLIAWLDEQERILRMRGVPAELVQEFDPINNLPEETAPGVKGPVGSGSIGLPSISYLERSISSSSSAPLPGMRGVFSVVGS